MDLRSPLKVLLGIGVILLVLFIVSGGARTLIGALGSTNPEEERPARSLNKFFNKTPPEIGNGFDGANSTRRHLPLH